MTIAEVVYILCAAMSCLCAVLLFRAYRQTGTRLLLWSSLCFAGFALNNVVVYLDIAVIHFMDLSIGRVVPALIGLMALLYGLIWETA